MDIKQILNQEDFEYVTFFIGKHQFGLDVKSVRDVFKTSKITSVPKARKEVYGVLNLRGKIVTVIDMYSLLGLDVSLKVEEPMYIVVEYHGESYALQIDKVGDVQSLNKDTFEENPRTMTSDWKGISKGIHKLPSDLLIILNVNSILSFIGNKKENVVC